MAARKLQTEIDKTLKKVSEGVEIFENLYDKMQASTNMTQKEKLEADLKTQIKKLQRMRDQIKTWHTNNDIKDKSTLIDNRKLIETQMEKFKACEKEMKTKAFSKQGLTLSAKQDPKAMEKAEQEAWVQSQIEELQTQVEASEAEIESLQVGGKKKKGASANVRLDELEHMNEKRKWHISRLEIVLRLLDNGTLSSDQVKELHENVSYIVSQEDVDFDDYETMYDDLNLDEEEERFGLGGEHEDEDGSISEVASDDVPIGPPRTPAKKQHHDDERETNGKREPASPVLKKATATLQLRRASAAAESKPPPNPNFAQLPMSSMLKTGLSTSPSAASTTPAAPRPPPPKLGYANVAASALPSAPSVATPKEATMQLAGTGPVPPTPATASSHSPPPQPTAPSIISSTVPTTTADASSSPSLTHPSVTSPMMSTASISGTGVDGSLYSSGPSDSPLLSEAGPAFANGPAATSSPARLHQPREGSRSSSPVPRRKATLDARVAPQASIAPNDSQRTIRANGKPLVSSTTTAPAPAPSPLPQQLQQVLSPSPVPQFPPGVKMPDAVSPPESAQVNQRQLTQESSMGANGTTVRPPSTQLPSAIQQRLPATMSDLVVSYESVKQKSANRMANLEQVHKLLDGGHQSVPQPMDTEKAKYYVPRNPWHTPSYYPQVPLPILSTAGIVPQLEIETLFYVFYYHPGTYQQYLAAKELKRQSWRFHVKYMTWFQRHSEPQAITDEYEQGVYVYFDWEGSWCQRKKSDFRFEYRYLSED